MSPEEKQQIREEYRTADTVDMRAYAARHLPALLAALDSVEERLRKMTTMWGQAVQKHEQSEAEVMRLQQERDEAVRLLEGFAAHQDVRMVEVTDFLRRLPGGGANAVSKGLKQAMLCLWFEGSDPVADPPDEQVGVFGYEGGLEAAQRFAADVLSKHWHGECACQGEQT